MATVINAAKRYPMMSEHQVVVVKEAQVIRNMEELSYYLQKPLLSTILVICHKHGTLDRRKKLAAEIEKVGVLFESKKIKEAQLPAFISSYMKRKGCLLYTSWFAGSIVGSDDWLSDNGDSGKYLYADWYYPVDCAFGKERNSDCGVCP